MDKKSKDIIKEVITDILEIREIDLKSAKSYSSPFVYHDVPVGELRKFKKEQVITKFDKPLIKLNTLLEKEDKFDKVLEIEKMQVKKYINVKEFCEIYSYSSDWQKNRRSRIHDHLPFIQTTNGGKITYNVKEIENWFKNNNSGR